MSKLKIGVIFGGRSGEHEVSLMSANAIISALDDNKYEVTPIGITKEGKWIKANNALVMLQQGKLPNLSEEESLSNNEIQLLADPTIESGFDVIFPVMHGTYGEDGSVQGLLELANIPYVGAGVASSAVSMDKAMMRVLFSDAGLPMVDWLKVIRSKWENQPNKVLIEIEEIIGYPCFVKPANLGSSVGITKAYKRSELEKALNLAAEFDRKLVIEKAVKNAREIECSVLGNDDPIVSLPGEIIPGSDFYDYQTKYFNDNSQLIIPADITVDQLALIKEYAVQAYKAVDCAGMARIDFFIDHSGNVLINEINTIPGFTKISMYPKLWEASGIPFAELIDKLIELALARYRDRNKTRTSL